MITYTQGNIARFLTTVKDQDDAVVDPATIMLSVKSSAGAQSIYSYPGPTIVRDAVGQYRADVPLTSIGVWEYQWTTTTPDSVEGGEVYVQADPVESAPSQSSVADYTRMWLGGDNWDALMDADNYGPAYVVLAMEAVKRRILASPPSAPNEHLLDGRVLDFIGISAAIQLGTALRSYWASQIISRSTGNDPAEVEVFTDRAKLVGDLLDDLLRRLPAVQAAAVPAIDDPVTSPSLGQPGTDELYDLDRTTEDPRAFPTALNFPYDHHFPRNR